MLGLVLTKIITKDGFPEFIDQTIIFDGGAQSADSAPRILVKPGGNILKFKLPASIKPVRTQVKFSGRGKADLSMELDLITASTTRPYTTTAKYYFYRPKGHPDEDAFWSLPGQTWSIGVSGYEMEGAKYGKIMISPEKDGVLRLKLNKSK